jgi:hypothetical protein
MSTKREDRKQRAEANREAEEHEKRRRRWRSRALAAAGALALIATALLSTRGHKDGEESNGRVWSAAHGHWHDKK